MTGPIEGDREKQIPFTWMLRSRFATKSSLDKLFRLFGAKLVLPDLYYIRPLLLGSHFLDVREVFARIHSWEDWIESWEQLGEKRETYARLAEEEHRNVTARENWIWAASGYHMAQVALGEETERKRELYRRCAACYARAAALLSPTAERREIPFDDIRLPAYLRLPPGEEPAPVLVLLCGADGAKEEMHFFAEGLLERGIGSLAVDGPGFGETWDRTALIGDFERVGRAVFDHLVGEKRVDPKRTGLFGVGYGGHLALRIAAFEERCACVVALSAPFDMSGYGEYVLPVIQEQMKYLLQVDSDDEYLRWAAGCSVRGLVERIDSPLLVIGAGEDLLIPGDDSKRIFDEARGKKKLIYFEEANHLCTEYVFDLVGKVEEWLIEIGFTTVR